MVGSTIYGNCGSILCVILRKNKGGHNYMKVFFLAVITTAIVFMFYKGLLVLVSRVLTKTICKHVKGESSFELTISIAAQVLFLSIWMITWTSLASKYSIDNLIFYISFCLIGVFCVIWCYFSWDIEHIFVMPRKAKAKHKKIKKIVLYTLIFIFVMCQGYFQTLHALDPTVEVNVLFQVTNYSIVVGIIALDRIMNQIFS